MSAKPVPPADVTIVAARYNGIYEGGKWLAFPLDPRKPPDDWEGNDIACATFFSHYDRPLGKGSTPDATHAGLLSQWSVLSRDEQLTLIRGQWEA